MLDIADIKADIDAHLCILPESTQQKERRLIDYRQIG
jgi:hypothetical protein